MIDKLIAATGKNAPPTFLGVQSKQTDTKWKGTSVVRYVIFAATGDRDIYTIFQNQIAAFATQVFFDKNQMHKVRVMHTVKWMVL